MIPRHITDAPLPYLLFEPGSAQPAPLVLFLHGAGERGQDLGLVATQGLPAVLLKQSPFPEPVRVIAPQCPADSWWTLELAALRDLLDNALARYPSDRIYLTGLSMGGYGSWHLAQQHPERFAALVPICGGGIRPLAGRLKGLPIWAFHGDQDEVVPLSVSQEMVEAVNAAGGSARLTVYSGVGHDSWSRAYAEPELYRWLLSHRQGT
jgi:predicted peptidase